MQMPLLRKINNGSSGVVRKGRNPIVTASIVIAIVCALIVAFNLYGKYVMLPKMFANMKPPAVVVSASEVKLVTWTPGIEAVGTARATRGVDVAAEVGGVVKSINFQSNSKAQAGQLLVQIDDAVERADMLAAEANIRLYEAQLSRVAELRRKGVNSQASLDDARAQLDVAKSTYARLAATAEKKAITALFGGTLGIARVDVGEYIEPGTIIVTLQDLSRIKVDFTLPEQIASQVAVGSPANFGETYTDLSFVGQITGIDPRVDRATRLVAIQAEVDNSSGRIQPGQFLRVRVDLPAKEGVIALPQSAVIPSLYGDYVYAAVPSAPSDAPAPKADETGAQAIYTARQVFVTQGRRSGAMVEIASGLKPGDVVVTAGQNKLFPGASLTIDNRLDIEKSARKGAGEIE